MVLMTRGMDFCFRTAFVDNLNWGHWRSWGLVVDCFVSFCETKYPKTPNFCLSIDDNPPRQENRTSQTSRLTLQYINDSRLGLLLPATIPNNSDLREPRDIANWPPAVVLDIAYASAALRAWAPESFIQTVRVMAKDISYKASPDNDHTSTPCEAQKRLLDARNKKKAQATRSKKRCPI